MATTTTSNGSITTPDRSYLSRVFMQGLGINRLDLVLMVPFEPPAVASWGALYDLLEAYYQNNRLYETARLGAEELGTQKEQVKSLRNPAFRAVEFYTSKLWPGSLPEALPIQTRNDSIIDPIHQVWKWSNWSNKKQLAARYIAEFGDLFLKVVQRSAEETDDGKPRVFFEVVKPRRVTELDTDERGYVTYIRLDVPKLVRNGDTIKRQTHTEVWSKQRGDMRIWRHERDSDEPIERLGPPDDSAELSEFGIDFVPFVHAPFRDIGETRGVAAFALQLDKIDEINAQVTRLHRIMFRYGRPIWSVLSNMLDATRRAMPAPRIEGQTIDAYGKGSGSTLSLPEEFEGEPILYVPGLSKLELLIPNIAYESFLNAIDAQMRELEDDLPELIYYRVIREYKSDSGRALSYALSPATDRVIEVRGNAESALVRANQMALTIGKAAGIWGASVGEYNSRDDANNFDHRFDPRPVIPLSDLDEAESDRTQSEALERKHNLDVPLERLWREMGYDEEEIEQNKKWLEEEQDAAMQRQEETMKMQAALHAPPPGGGNPAALTRLAAPARPGFNGVDRANASRDRNARGGPRGTQSKNDPNISR